jgi:hypothetical protein
MDTKNSPDEVLHDIFRCTPCLMETIFGIEYNIRLKIYEITLNTMLKHENSKKINFPKSGIIKFRKYKSIDEAI